jgi:hypothetical protein
MKMATMMIMMMMMMMMMMMNPCFYAAYGITRVLERLASSAA